MGFMDSLFDKNVANSTKCTSWKQVQESHTISNQDIGLKLKDLRGYAIALASGLSAALFMFIAENMMQWCTGFDEVGCDCKDSEHRHTSYYLLFAGQGSWLCANDSGV